MTNLPKTSYIFIDRRKTSRGKSLPNRQRLLRRIKAAVRSAKPGDIDAGGVKNIGGASNGAVNPVKVTRNSLHEPTFHYASGSGEFDIVLIGNDQWERGDEFPMDGGGQGKGRGKGGPGEDGEDDFVVNISREEFFDVFFEDCVLPDLQDSHERDLPEMVSKPAGFQKEGNPGQLSVVRSYKQALPRRKIIQAPYREELEALMTAREELLQEQGLVNITTPRLEEINEALYELDEKISYLKRKIEGVPFFEKIDLRYAKREKVQVKAADAVFIMVMDISGSMDEDKKRMARKFFSLQYAFIKRKYPQTDLIFVAHTDSPEELTEQEFFTTRKSGGTIVSTAYELVHQIIRSRYDARETNIYLSQASDGDNWDTDNAEIIPALETSGLLAKVRYMSYAQVGQGFSMGSYAYASASVTLWSVLQSIANTTNKIAMVKINDDSEVFDAFHKIYRIKDKK